MEKFLFTLDKDLMVKNGKTDEMFNAVVGAIVAEFGTVEPYTEPVIENSPYTQEEIAELKEKNELQTKQIERLLDLQGEAKERIITLEQELELYAPLITAYNTMTAAERNAFEAMSKKSASDAESLAEYEQFKPVIQMFKSVSGK